MKIKELIKKIFSINSNNEDLLGDAKKLLMTGKLKTNFDFEKFSKKNIFNELSKSSNYGFYYWPYGYLFRHVKWGSVNDLGFRCKENFYEINNIYKNYYLIGFFGGSTGYDVLVKDEETLVNKIENKINNDQKLKDNIGKCKIINFSQPGNVLMSQIFNYIQFGNLMNLNMVISHNSGNDLTTGLVNDPKILKNYKIAYVDIMEAWSRKIHDAHDVEIDTMFMDKNSSNFRKVETKTDPDTVIMAYLFRCNQFKNIVTKNNQTFISGIMPHVFSKKNPSENEKLIYQNYNLYFQKPNSILPKVYEILISKYYNEISKFNLVNLHNDFKNLSSNIDHFGDFVHLLNAGNEVAAESYFKKIKKIILDRDI